MKQAERHLPKQVDAFKLTQQAAVLDGYVKLAELPRLVNALDNAGNVPDLHPVLRFGTDGQGHRTVEGQVTTELPLTCQRCLKVMSYKVVADIHGAFVTSDEAAKKLPSHLDPVMLPASGYVDVYEMLEDELLLSLPIAAFHDDCEGAGVTKVFGEIESGSTAVKEKPFIALADLLKSGSVKKEH